MRDRMKEFLDVNGSYTRNVSKLEHNILFGNKEQVANLQNMSDYTKLPFYLGNRGI